MSRGCERFASRSQARRELRELGLDLTSCEVAEKLESLFVNLASSKVNAFRWLAKKLAQAAATRALASRRNQASVARQHIIKAIDEAFSEPGEEINAGGGT